MAYYGRGREVGGRGKVKKEWVARSRTPTQKTEKVVKSPTVLRQWGLHHCVATSFLRICCFNCCVEQSHKGRLPSSTPEVPGMWTKSKIKGETGKTERLFFSIKKQNKQKQLIIIENKQTTNNINNKKQPAVWRLTKFWLLNRGAEVFIFLELWLKRGNRAYLLALDTFVLGFVPFAAQFAFSPCLRFLPRQVLLQVKVGLRKLSQSLDICHFNLAHKYTWRPFDLHK